MIKTLRMSNIPILKAQHANMLLYDVLTRNAT